MSNLKHSNLTSLATTQKKTQDKSLEEQVYEMPIENIEAERLRKTFLRICGEKVNNKSGEKDNFNKKPYISDYLVFRLTKRMWSEYWLNSVSLTTNLKSISGSGKSMRILMAKSTNMSSLSCTKDASLIRLVLSLAISLTWFSFWCMTWPAETKLQSKIPLNWSMFVTLTLTCFRIIYSRFLAKERRLRTARKGRFFLMNIWSKWGRMTWTEEKS